LSARIPKATGQMFIQAEGVLKRKRSSRFIFSGGFFSVIIGTELKECSIKQTVIFPSNTTTPLYSGMSTCFGLKSLSRFGLKVHCGKGSRTFSTRRNLFTFLSPEAISWWLADFGLWQEGRLWPRLPAEFGCDAPGHSDFGFRLRRICWVRRGQPRKKDAPWDSRRVGRRLRYVRTKSSFEWWILNSVLCCVLRHTGRSVPVAYLGILFGRGLSNSVEDRENRDLGAVAP